MSEGRARILVVDDEPAIRNVIVRILSAAHEVVALDDANVALQRVEAGERFDLILCDLKMPQLSGTALHAALVDRAPEQARRLVFISGNRASAATDAGAADVPVLEKPFTPAALRARVGALLAAWAAEAPGG